MKICSCCKQFKDFSNFFKSKRTKDGFNGQCKICSNLGVAKWIAKNLEKSAIYKKTYTVKNLEKVKLSKKKYADNNKGKMTTRANKRRASKLNRTPSWLTKEQLKEIEQWYVIAKDLQWLSEEPLQVDHIVPLQGKNVSGLHVPWNLQILPRSLNISKGNKI